MGIISIISIISLVISIFSLVILFYFSLYSSIIDRFNKFNEHIAEIDIIIINNPELIYIYDNEELERRRMDSSFYNKMSAFIYLHFNMFENAYIQFISKRTLFFRKQKSVWNNLIILLFKIKLVNELWDANKEFYDKDFTIYIDKLINITK